MDGKRSRSVNWDEDEKELLRSFINSKIHIIECKAQMTFSLRNKKAAWREIAELFNAANKRQRDVKQLQTQWKIMKMYARKNDLQCKREIIENGIVPGSLTPSANYIDIVVPRELGTDYNHYTNSLRSVIGDVPNWVEVTPTRVAENQTPVKEEPLSPMTEDVIEEEIPIEIQQVPKPGSSVPILPMFTQPLKKKPVLREWKLDRALFKSRQDLMGRENQRKEQLHQLRLLHMQEDHSLEIQIKKKMLLQMDEIHKQRLSKLQLELEVMKRNLNKTMDS